jgi:hypothetical protein
MALFFTLLAGSLLASCGKPGTGQTSCDNGYPVRSAANASYHYQSNLERFSYTVSGEMALTRLQLVFEQKEGSVSWSFTDPLGEVQWQGEFGQAGRMDEIREFNPIQGEWQLEIDGSDGSGRYVHCWMAK